MPVHAGATWSAKCADAADELDLRRVRSELRTECWTVCWTSPQEILQQIKLRQHLWDEAEMSISVAMLSMVASWKLSSSHEHTSTITTEGENA